VRLYFAILVAALLALAAVFLGLWWAPFVVGVALGALGRRARVAVPAGAAIGLVAWAIPLAAVHIQYGLGPTTQSLAAIIGFDHQGGVPVVVTLLVGTLLGATGAWLGRAAHSVAPRRSG